MKMKTLSVLAGVGAPLIATASASAGFVFSGGAGNGLEWVIKDNGFGILTYNVYAVFDRPDPGDGSGDHMVAVAGTPGNAMNIQVLGGTFYNHSFGTDVAPLGNLVAAFPSLAYDTFVTIGVKRLGLGGQPVDSLTITPGFPAGITGSSLAGTTFGWAVTPTAAQGNPFDAVNSYAGNGHILIGQFSTTNGTAIQGTMLVQYVSNGASGSQSLSFGFPVPSPGAFALLGTAGLFSRRRRRR